MLTIVDVPISKFPKTVCELAEEEGVTPGAIYMRRERASHPEREKERTARFLDKHPGYRTSPRARRMREKSRKAFQDQTILGATHRWQLWTPGARRDLEARYKRGETATQIAKALGRTYRGISRALHRFGLSERREELLGQTEADTAAIPVISAK